MVWSHVHGRNHVSYRGSDDSLELSRRLAIRGIVYVTTLATVVAMPPTLTPLDEAAVCRVRDALTDLMRCRPDDWAELVPVIAGEICALSPWSMNLLADASVQIAITAHRLAVEADDELDR